MCASVTEPTPAIIRAARGLSQSVSRLRFADPVHTVYNPLDYAWDAHEAYLQRYGRGTKRVVFLGMNPGPWGMAQVGVPFGEIPSVRDWLGIEVPVRRPDPEHPKRPIQGFGCKRSEVSGRRLWGLFARRFGSAEAFFQDHFVLNYCPLVFMLESGANHTPDKLPSAERESLYRACDEHLRQVIEALNPVWVIGVGKFAETRARESLQGALLSFGSIAHPSPANPAANRGWDALVIKQMEELGLW